MAALSARALRNITRQLSEHCFASARAFSSQEVIKPTEEFCDKPAFDEEEQKRRKVVDKLKYRSKQRGLLELDLLIGEYAEREFPKMNHEQLQAAEAMLHEENPDMWKWLTQQEVAPDSMQQNEVFRDMQRYVGEELLHKSSADTRAPAGEPWVRGWDDYKKPVYTKKSSPDAQASQAAAVSGDDKLAGAPSK